MQSGKSAISTATYLTSGHSPLPVTEFFDVTARSPHVLLLDVVQIFGEPRGVLQGLHLQHVGHDRRSRRHVAHHSVAARWRYRRRQRAVGGL